MKEYNCEECGKNFKQKCHWVNHTQNKKYPCVKQIIKNENVKPGVTPQITPEFTPGIINKNINFDIDNKKYIDESNNNILEINQINNNKKCSICRFCLKQFSRPDSLKRHIYDERCEVLKIQNQQKENIFINLLEEEKVVNQTKKELKELNNDINTKKKII